MNVFIYDCDLYCEQCGEAIRNVLDNEGSDIDPDDEHSYDSGEYPKGPIPDGGGIADYPQHCASGGGCENAIHLSDGASAGAWLGNGLTPLGVEYVREAMRGGGEVAELWEHCYSDLLHYDD
jgi:hypothetical protein